MRINITTNKSNTWGLSKDVKLIQHALRAHDLKVSHHARVEHPGKFHLNIHLEILAGKHIRQAVHNAIIPNPEWFMGSWLERVKRRNFLVWTKTDDGTRIFRKLGLPAEKIGFTSEDRWLGVPFDQRRYEFLHLAGNSLLKNTLTVAEAWAHNPHWPKLHIYTSNSDLIKWLQNLKARNIKLTTKHVPNKEILQMQNECLFSVQPSEAEGYGHCIVEPLSAGAIVISTGGGPMNEFPIIETPAKITGQQWYGNRYALTDLNGTIEKVLAMDTAELKNMHVANRKWWRKNDAQFRANLKNAVNKVPH